MLEYLDTGFRRYGQGKEWIPDFPTKGKDFFRKNNPG